MKIRNLRPVSSGGGAIGYAEIEISAGVRLFDVKIIRKDDGSIRVYARNAAFDREAIEEISKSFIGGACLELTSN